MNSKQRRQEKRKFKYVVTVDEEHLQAGDSYNKYISQRHDWCKKNIKNEYQTRIDWRYTLFKFSSSKDATLFSLRWL